MNDQHPSPDYYDQMPSPDHQVSGLKLPPHSIEAEQSVIGGLLLQPEKFDDVVSAVKAEDFYRKEHILIFSEMAYMHQKQQTVDIVTISESLYNKSKLEEAGNTEYLGDLASSCPSAANILAYAKIVHDRAVLRRMIMAVNSIADSCYNTEGRSVEEIASEAQGQMLAVNEKVYRSDLTGVNVALQSALDEIDRRSKLGSNMVGLPTGFQKLDDMTAGFEKGDLIIVAGRPSMGKTTLAMNMAERAVIHKNSALVFSLEMNRDSLMMRAISSLSGVFHDQVRKGRMNDGDWPKVAKATNLLKDTNFWIDDTPGLTTSELRSKVRRHQRKYGNPGVIVVDYIQIMGDVVREGGANARITEISRNLKSIAKEFHCPLIALSQLNRGVDSRPNKRPMMSDLRESGALEQDADIIMFMYRDEYYHPETTNSEGLAECIIGKQRNGPTGHVFLKSELQYVRFTDYMGPDPAMGKSNRKGQKTALDFVDDD